MLLSPCITIPIARTIGLNPAPRIRDAEASILEDTALNLTLHLGAVTRPDPLFAEDTSAAPVIVRVDIVDPVVWGVRGDGASVETEGVLEDVAMSHIVKKRVRVRGHLRERAISRGRLDGRMIDKCRISCSSSIHLRQGCAQAKRKGGGRPDSSVVARSCR